MDIQALRTSCWTPEVRECRVCFQRLITCKAKVSVMEGRERAEEGREGAAIVYTGGNKTAGQEREGRRKKRKKEKGADEAGKISIERN